MDTESSTVNAALVGLLQPENAMPLGVVAVAAAVSLMEFPFVFVLVTVTSEFVTVKGEPVTVVGLPVQAALANDAAVIVAVAPTFVRIWTTLVLSVNEI